MVNERLQHSDFLKFGFFIAALALIWNLPTLGNNLMPRNFMGWFGIIVISGLVISFSIWNGKLLFSKSLILLFIPSVAFLLHGTIFPPTETMHYYMWLAIGASFTFGIYLLALSQVDDSDNVWLSIANVMLVVLSIQSLISDVLPAFTFGKFILGFFPIELIATQAGFQQANLMASFIAALLLWSWGLRLKLKVTSSKSWAFLFVISLFLSFIIFQTGSRTAGLALLVGTVFLLIYSYGVGMIRQSLIIVSAILIALFFDLMGGIGESRKGDFVVAAADVVSGQNTNVRIMFWQVAFFSGLENWLFGHGLGNFQQAYYETYLAYKSDFPLWQHVPSLAHPHNEIMMHWVEMGLTGMFFVIAPVVIFLFRVFLLNSKYLLLLISSLLPIGLHSQTEMVLHASGAHWLLAGLIIASLMNRADFKVHLLPKFGILLPIALSVVGLWVTVSSAIAGTNAFWNKISADRAANLGLHLKRLTQGEELNHWILGTETNDRVIKSMMAVALNTNNKNAIKKFLPRLIDMSNRWQHTDAWAQIAQAYLVLGDIDKYKSHMKKVRIFDPKYADFLEKAFDVKLDPVKS